MTMPSLGVLRNASSATASTVARAVNQPGWRNANAYAILIRAVSAYNARPMIRRGNDVRAPPPTPFIPPLPAVRARLRLPPTSFLGSTFGIAYNDNTKDDRAKEEKEGLGDGHQAQYNT
jgi:hypothetical protein